LSIGWLSWWSGCCSAAAFFVVTTLRNLARDGRTVISSIHQPSSEVFELFDNLTLLSGGRCMYFGVATDAYQVRHYTYNTNTVKKSWTHKCIMRGSFWSWKRTICIIGVCFYLGGSIHRSLQRWGRSWSSMHMYVYWCIMMIKTSPRDSWKLNTWWSWLIINELFCFVQHFATAGFPCPELQNPSDHYLRAVNTDFDQLRTALQQGSNSTCAVSLNSIAPNCCSSGHTMQWCIKDLPF